MNVTMINLGSDPSVKLLAINSAGQFKTYLDNIEIP